MSSTEILGIVSPVPMGTWNNTTTYQKLNIVRYNGASYMARQSNIAVEPGVSTNWQLSWIPLAYDGGAVSPDGNYPAMSVGNADDLGTIPAAEYVQVNAQTFTDAQQTQAQKNIGIQGNIYFGKTVSPLPANFTYIQCAVSGTVSTGTYYFINCQGAITVSGANVKVYITDSPNLTVSGITSQNWFNVYRDGVARFTALNSTVTITKDTATGTVICAMPTMSDSDDIEISYTGMISGFGYAGYKVVTNRKISNRTTLYANVSRTTSGGEQDENKAALNINLGVTEGVISTNLLMFVDPSTDQWTFNIYKIEFVRRLS